MDCGGKGEERINAIENLNKETNKKEQQREDGERGRRNRKAPKQESRSGLSSHLPPRNSRRLLFLQVGERRGREWERISRGSSGARREQKGEG